MTDWFFIFAAQYLFVFSCVISGLYFFRQEWPERKRIILFALPSLVLTYILGLVAAHFYYDPRPFVVDHFIPLIPHAPDNGFPSDHALLVSSIAVIGLYLHKRLGAVLSVIAVLVMAGRVYVGVHHVIDVVASVGISLFATTLVYFLIRFREHTKLRT